MYSATIVAPNVTATTEYKFVTHTRVDDNDTWSPAVKVRVSPSTDTTLPTVTITSPTGVT